MSLEEEEHEALLQPSDTFERKHDRPGSQFAGDDLSWHSSASDASSGSLSDYDGSESEWETAINPQGELFYIRTELPQIPQTSSQFAQPQQTVQDQQALKSKGVSAHRSSPQSVPKVKFQDWREGEVRDVDITVNLERTNLGRRATSCEILLGLIPGSFSPSDPRVMVAGFVPDGASVQHSAKIKVGDWLRNINDREVTNSNLDEVLASITEPCNVKLVLQRVGVSEVKTDGPGSDRRLLQDGKHCTSSGTTNEVSALASCSGAVMYMTLSGISESSPEGADLLFSFPPSAKGPLQNGRGVFSTLSQLMRDATGDIPIRSSVIVDGQWMTVFYFQEKKDVLIIALPENKITMLQAKALTSELRETLSFCFGSLSRAFCDESQAATVNRLLTNFFAIAMPNSVSSGLPPSGEVTTHPMSCELEMILPGAPRLQLPNHFQVLVEDLLADLEAADFGKWGEDTYDMQRQYLILGTSIFHKGLVLCSHLPLGFLRVVYGFLRFSGLLELSKISSVQQLLVWREVFPESANESSTDNNDYKSVHGRYFLLVAGKCHDLLVVLLEAGGCTERAPAYPRPDPMYVDRAQCVLNQLHHMGFPSFCTKILESGIGPKIRTADNGSRERGTGDVSGGGVSSFEVTSILKRRGSLGTERLLLVPHTGETSEDSVSQAASNVSEYSDEAAPILGRRAEWKRVSTSDKNDDDDSDNDHVCDDDKSGSDDVCQSGQHPVANLNDIKQPLQPEMEIKPIKITAGSQNLLLHYLYLDPMEGVLLSSHQEAIPEIVENFKRCCLVIRNVLHNTIRFKWLISQDAKKSWSNKSLIAVKEHGILFECPSPPQVGSTSNKKDTQLCYWVVGRLLFDPHPREVFVCHQDSVPQSVIELAFRIALGVTL